MPDDDTLDLGDSSEPENEYASWLEDLTAHFNNLSFDGIPDIPTSNRPLGELIQDHHVWSMSLSERAALLCHWDEEVREVAYDKQKEEFGRLKMRHKEAKERWEQVDNERKLAILKRAILIGCTTNGAARLTTLLNGVSPKVLLIEEAGQVLEAHVLASLVSSVQQMILIGDPLQLRPTVENYFLSMDNPKTGHIYRFDQSLMERLSSTGFHMSRLDVQRRMRPRISELVRCTLYPTLQDNDLVTKYPSVRGMAKDVFFLDHRHPEEGGGDDSVSKTNSFEARMIKDLVLYFLKQGKYTHQGDIVVLCAYLGQLVKIRKELANEVATAIDERDAVQLVDHEDDEDVANIINDDVAEQVRVSSRVLLRTVDNFQ
ncbi:hypothetical protein FRB99_004317, partial [Tulasnella sp. 403]